MNKLRQALAKRMGDFALLVGAGLTSAGAGMICEPAGVITAGILLMVGAVLAGGDK